MKIPFLLRIAAVPLCALTFLSIFAQDLPSMPPERDPSFWGRSNEPYVMSLTITTVKVDASNTPQTRIATLKMYRDSAGRERADSFYDDGQPMGVTLRDPSRDTATLLKVVSKSAFVLYTPRPTPSPPGKGWVVERLQPRVLEGYPAKGLRFTRTIPASTDGTVPPVTLTEEDWISNELGVVLEQVVDNSRTGRTTKTVTRLQRIEPDPTLFAVPSEYTVQRLGPVAP